MGSPIWPAQSGGWAALPSPHDSWWSGAVKRCQKSAEDVRAAELKAADAKAAAELAAHPDRAPVTAVVASTPVFPSITPHDLRHTAASLAISAAANVKAVQQMLGHKSAAMTLDTYADLFDGDLAAVADRLQKNVAVCGGKPGFRPSPDPEMQNDQHFRAGHRCSPDWTRTNNRPINSRELCQLSYRGLCSGPGRVSLDRGMTLAHDCADL